MLASWPNEGDFPRVKTVSWEVTEALGEAALTAFGHEVVIANKMQDTHLTAG